MYAEGPWQFVARHCPTPSLPVFGVYAVWILAQSALYNYLPAPLSTGQLTPAGHLLQYHTNGLGAWAVTHIALASGVFFRLIDPAWIAKNWPDLLVAANSYGFLLTVLVYIKAYVAPTHAKDRKFSGSILYDFYMGIEFNPRLGEFWDFKLFHVGRPGMIAWTLIDLSFAAWQYEKLGFVTNSMVIVNILHAIYVVDFFINEDWYLRTIDICHDHFGFYLGWSSVTWLPAMYTIQAQYLVYNPVSLSPFAAACILATGLGGYFIFRSVNHEKDLVRRTKGECLIGGRPAGVLKCTYRTADGKQHQSLLLYTGWWGLSRHANYLGDLILSYSMCAACGFDNLLPHFYAIFMTILLLHRCKRTEQSCAAKYGGVWDTYCQKVKWILIPGVY
ncbi:ergosterol biosynthesis ERG4/ERG24 [Xylogone sp. PMI_703]|nr:ergosterol biosynthesis ERG4/ERG24 [Xylogone sp. PMI_703]